MASEQLFRIPFALTVSQSAQRSPRSMPAKLRRRTGGRRLELLELDRRQVSAHAEFARHPANIAVDRARQRHCPYADHLTHGYLSLALSLKSTETARASDAYPPMPIASRAARASLSATRIGPSGTRHFTVKSIPLTVTQLSQGTISNGTGSPAHGRPQPSSSLRLTLRIAFITPIVAVRPGLI
jgi:hypothetical protein